jgi:hypothetical protein
MLIAQALRFQVGKMSAPNAKRAAVLGLLRDGLVTCDEAADLAATSRQLVQDWAAREGIDIATTRATYLLRLWHSQLIGERVGKTPAREEPISNHLRS